MRVAGREKVAKHINKFIFFFFPRRHVDTIKLR